MRRRSGFGWTAILAALALTACGPTRVTVVVELENEDGGEPTLLDDVMVRLLPYDRDHIFDSLTAEADVPEPGIPAELLAAQEEIARAQQEWRDATDRMNIVRDTMRKLNEELAQLNPAMNIYREIFAEFERWERQEASSRGAVGALFNRFDSLQKATIQQMDSVSNEREAWADLAFMDVGVVIDARIEETGLEDAADTTGVEGPGVAVFDVPPGEYWVYTRYELPYNELYWNVPVTVARGEPVLVRLSRENAELRPIL